jgi:DNA-binding PadR family transcriptional regulator
MHGYTIAQTIPRQTDEALLVEEGALYPALYRMYWRQILSTTPDGRRRLREEMKTWTHYAKAVGKILSASSKPQWEKTSAGPKSPQGGPKESV